MERITVAVVVSMWAIPVSILVNRIVPDPYMDEIFHVPQAQRYCRGDFTYWDPMITTPPGLYYLSLAYVASLFPGMWFAKAVQSFSLLCSTTILRSTNIVFAIICSILVYDLLILLRPTMSKRKATLYAIVLMLYPVHWFFTFLYYTDVASLTAVLAMYVASLKKKYWISAMLGAFAILIRQTNAVWMVFIAANGAITYTENLYEKVFVPRNHKGIVFESNNLLLDRKDVPTDRGLRRRKISSSINTTDLSKFETGEHSLCHAPGFIDEILDTTLRLWCFKWKVLLSFAPFIMVALAFLAFVIWNGSIVLGAKEAHVVSPHLAQLMYFGLVSAAAFAPLYFNLGQAAALYHSFGRNKVLGSLLVLVALTVGFTSVHFFSIAHPYLLADNRHYTFYIWRKVIQVHWMMKYLLVPLYVYSWFSIISILGKARNRIWVFSFFISCALVLVPAPLIEFRYYTIPFFFLILHSQVTDYVRWLTICTLYVAVNIFTMTMFLFRPFHWDHEPGTQRFIW
uniref:Dol-P-Glc:Glc(2)Man(9)GlcNAc(2)-PP-Dol alpha-1,2-glucosyltransferase n=2 Tax=Elaeis guineensis var. tenera TaxID=51953 RepID=A0A6J0PGQ1_ELAGV|nr:dol-P-Glc:Glc(2)Man(9)GlcNAc(2)-PP-Dol alpha-1,2-glucosyltransferase isoform X1 [Elaeis guineensis]XP_019705140.1 dol-P-Glc:Glc(2)Man(9)GlcNAc(2)-PP-Dol alpha-1,2-glucosyltransferase isoform X1 [Elaeis guineensis]XP_029119021.1 dol-P-Glc:Glc(2)Man(9)GlcNAc(2)-PP-Dol alpha-1,2-glucosyltransferase isoform X1 [Elaeis guineensis]